MNTYGRNIFESNWPFKLNLPTSNIKDGNRFKVEGFQKGPNAKIKLAYVLKLRTKQLGIIIKIVIKKIGIYIMFLLGANFWKMVYFLLRRIKKILRMVKEI